MSYKVQFPFAYDENNNLVLVEDIDIEHRHEHSYHCPSCGHSMLPRLGEHNAKHFYHSDNQKCGVESYVHKVGKELLLERFLSEKTFLIKFKQKALCELYQTCDVRKQAQQNHPIYSRPLYRNRRSICEVIIVKEFDLKDWYDTAEIEKEYYLYDGSVFRPDVLLSSTSCPSRPPFFLEVCYKHSCSNEKRESGIRILEVKIDSLSDLSRIKDIRVFSQNRQISLINVRKETTCTKKVIKEYSLGVPCSFKNLINLSWIIKNQKG